MADRTITTALLLAAAYASGVAAQADRLTPDDVMRLRSVTAVFGTAQDGLFVFTRTAPRGPKDGQPGPARERLFAIRDGRERALVAGDESVRGVAMHPDGRRVCFLREGDGHEHAEVYAMALDGGAATRVTRTPRGIATYRWRPDGKAIAFTVRDEIPPDRERDRRDGFRQSIVDEQHVHVSLWLHDLNGGINQRLTEGVTVNSYRWSPDGKRLAAGIAPRNSVDHRYMFTRLHVVEPGGDVEKLVDNPGKLGAYAWSPDGQRLAYVSAVDRRDPHAGTLYVVDREKREPRCLTCGFEGMVHDVHWRGDDRILCTVSVGVRNELRRIDAASGEMSRVEWSPNVAFRAFDPRSRTLVGSTPDYPDEAFRVDGNGRLVRLTRSNPWLARRRLGHSEVVRFRARDGLEIEGILMYPHPRDYRPGLRFPLVVVAHGGPESHFSNGWNTSYSRPGQLLSARGWFAWYPNYRASTGRGVEFAKADHGDIMGSEFHDVLGSIDHLVRRGLADRARIGIVGGSYGGLMAAWGATRHTDHFAAAVSFVPVTDLVTKTYLTDIPYEAYLVHQEEMWPHEQRGYLRDRSPLTWADRCRTPLLLAGGTADTRVHPSQPFMLYRAVKFTTETPVRYVQYPGEGHGNRVNTAQYDYMLRTLRWFEHYLLPGNMRNTPLPPLNPDYGTWLDAR